MTVKCQSGQSGESVSPVSVAARVVRARHRGPDVSPDLRVMAGSRVQTCTSHVSAMCRVLNLRHVSWMLLMSINPRDFQEKSIQNILQSEVSKYSWTSKNEFDSPIKNFFLFYLFTDSSVNKILVKHKLILETAMLLPGKFSQINNEVGEADSYDVRQNLKTFHREENTDEYCVVFRVEKVTKSCLFNEDTKRLVQGKSS